MVIYCLNCRKKPKNLDLKISEAKNGRIIMQPKCAACGIKKSIFVKKKKRRSKNLLSNLGIKTTLS